MGLVDLTLGNLKNLFYKEKKEIKLVKKELDKNEKETILIFLGWKGKTNQTKILYPKFGKYNKIIYELPETLISSDLNLMKKSWEEVEVEIKKDCKNNNVVATYGISLGTVFATLSANKNISIKKVYLAMPFDSLFSIISKTPIMKKIYRKIKNNNEEKKLENVLKKYEPKNNLDKLKNKKIKIFAAMSDSIVKYENTKNLIKLIKKNGGVVKLKSVPFLGHYLGGVYSVLNAIWIKK